MKAAAAALGMIMLTLPAVTAPAPALALGGVGVLLVLGSVTGRLGRLPWIGTAAGATAVVLSVIGHPGAVSQAAEGLLILGYVILLDWPQPAERGVAWRWLRQQAPAGLAGLIATWRGPGQPRRVPACLAMDRPHRACLRSCGLPGRAPTSAPRATLSTMTTPPSRTGRPWPR